MQPVYGQARSDPHDLRRIRSYSVEGGFGITRLNISFPATQCGEGYGFPGRATPSLKPSDFKGGTSGQAEATSAATTKRRRDAPAAA